MIDNEYKVIADNLGEYSVLTKDNELVVTEIQNKITAECFCDKLNEMHNENVWHLQIVFNQEVPKK